MAASPEFYKPSSTPAFSPLQAPVVPDREDDYYSSCRTPTGSGISYLREPTTCPPAPRKAPPPPCKKRLFQQQGGHGEAVPLISLRLDELHSIFRPHPQQPPPDKRRRSARHQRSLDAAAKPLEA